jgi:hypothetical protein
MISTRGAAGRGWREREQERGETAIERERERERELSDTPTHHENISDRRYTLRWPLAEHE